MTITPVNDAPTAVDDSASTDIDTAITFDLIANDSDPENDSVFVAALGQASNGTVTDNGDGTVTYTPNSGFEGQDSFTYTLDDGNGGTDMDNVTVDVEDDTGPTTTPTSPDGGEEGFGGMEILLLLGLVGGALYAMNSGGLAL